MCCTRLAENTGRKKSPFCHHRTTLSGCIFAAEEYIDNRKNLLNIDTSPTCPHNMVNFGLLTAEICWRVWGTPANFNGFHVLAALLHGTRVVGVSQTAALNRERHPYSAGRPSRWALAHILVLFRLRWRGPNLSLTFQTSRSSLALPSITFGVVLDFRLGLNR